MNSNVFFYAFPTSLIFANPAVSLTCALRSEDGAIAEYQKGTVADQDQDRFPAGEAGQI